jgi:hypothetical protein
LPSLKPASKYLRAEHALCRNYTFHVLARKRLADDSARVNARGRRVEINLSAEANVGKGSQMTPRRKPVMALVGTATEFNASE